MCVCLCVCVCVCVCVCACMCVCVHPDIASWLTGHVSVFVCTLI